MIGNKILGNLGEDLASDFLVKKGYRIVERNLQPKIHH
jgi:Holliday junction resolvase-like predicted endonuclease